MKIPIVIFIHIGALDINITQPIIDKIIFNLNNSGLYNLATKIYCGVVGKDLDLVQLPKKCEIIYKNYDPSVYEIPTINKLLEFVKTNKNHYILYLHTKGATKKKCNGINYQEKWSDVMQHFCIKNHKKCVELLDKGYDTVGCLLQNILYFGAHYSGNFWWTKSSYIKNHDYLPKDTTSWGRGAEFWLLPKFNINTNIASLYNNSLTYKNTPPCNGLYGNIIENYENTNLDNIKTCPKFSIFLIIILILLLILIIFCILKK